MEIATNGKHSAGFVRALIRCPLFSIDQVRHQHWLFERLREHQGKGLQWRPIQKPSGHCHDIKGE